jgi:Tfp pilus assembly protein FimV
MSLLLATPSPARRQVPHLRLVHGEPVRPACRVASPESTGSGPVRRAAARPARDTPMRLTRRGRLVVGFLAGLLVLVAVAAGVLLISRPAQAGSTPQAVPVTYRIVLPGQTLWQIAGQIAPGVDPRTTVQQIVDLNALPSAAVSAGQRIAVPARSA